MKALLVIVLLAAVLFADAKRIGCHRFCMARVLDKDIKSSNLKDCLQQCLTKKNVGKDDAVKAIKLVNKFAKSLDKDVQSKVAELKPEDNVSSDSEIASGATLKTTTALNVRSGACTDKSIVTTLQAGATVTFNGGILTACGYTWYQVKGSFGTGWAASNFLTQSSSPSTPTGNGCRVKFNAPLFKQCDSRWGSNKLGRDSTICKVGCLMSSVSMGLNALGKTINGQSANPGTLNSFLLANGGYYGNLFVWGSVSRFGLNYLGQPSDKNTIKQHICNNKIVILNVNHGGHWVLATGYDGDTFYVNDPGFSRSTYSAGEVGVAGVYSF